MIENKNETIYLKPNIGNKRRNSDDKNKEKYYPHLWYDKDANEAAVFYATIFPDSRITSVTTLRDTPSGNTDIVFFEL